MTHEFYFQRVTPGAYDADTGDYADDTIVETLRYASVMDTGRETLRLVYGETGRGACPYRFRGIMQKPLTA